MTEKSEKKQPRLAVGGDAVIDPHPWNPPALELMTSSLRFAERVMFSVVGIVLFVAGFILALRSCVDVAKYVRLAILSWS